MKGTNDDSSEDKMKMWKMKEEMLNSMTEKELRAFIKGYMMGQKSVLKQLSSMGGCSCGGCGSDSSCNSDSCGCGKEECNCGKD
ncbi:MAG: hypothetical protein KGH72_06150 [Candidatus Micrarchaeota archaeon]|nr:hypothetical protein [Candidatus Micrarchaeota archaeon]